MKLNFGKRFALILHWLGSVIALAALVFNARALELVQTVQNRIGEKYTHMVFVHSGAVHSAQALWQALGSRIHHGGFL